MRIAGEIVNSRSAAADLTQSRSTRSATRRLDTKAGDSYCSLSPACPFSFVRASADLSEELPKKRRRTEVFVSSNWQPWCGGGYPPRPQARSQKAAARGSAANEAPGDPRGPRKGRPRAHSSFLILEHPTASKVATAVNGGDSEILCVLYDDPIGGYPKSYARDGIPKSRCSKARR